MKNPAEDNQHQNTIGNASRLPPRAATSMSPEEAIIKRQQREQKEAQVRGLASIPTMRDAILRAARDLADIVEIQRVRIRNAAAFAERATAGLPFVISDVVSKWPLSNMTPDALRERFGHVPVRARVGDYINTAFAPDRAMQDMTLQEYLDSAHEATDLPPYLGNLEMRELNALCHWPTYFKKMGPPRFWLGPKGTVTPLHCDYDDNIFAQIIGTKRIFLAPPHHGEFLYLREANALLFGSPFDPEAPDFDAFPLARQATMIECIMQPGDMLYVPAGWFHQVRALSFSVSANRWARGVPLALAQDGSPGTP